MNDSSRPGPAHNLPSLDDIIPVEHSGLPRIWREAAVFGALWGAAEVTLGSFLHASRLPLAGVVMAALGIGLLTAARMVSGRPGLPWRMALVCAALRALSPEGLMPGPMAAIVLQGLLVTVAFALLRRALPAAMLAGALATLATQVQAFVVKLVAFGADFLTLLLELIARAESVLHLPPGSGWVAVVIYLAVIAAIGMVGGAAGWRTGHLATRHQRDESSSTDRDTLHQARPHSLATPGVRATGLHATERSPGDTAPSPMAWVVALAGLVLAFSGHPPALAGGLTVVVGWCAWRDRLALRRVGRPRFWVFSITLTLLAGLLLGDETMRWGSVSISLAGMQAGAWMIVRGFTLALAAVLLAGSLPRGRALAWGRRAGLRHLDAAFDQALRVLPDVQGRMAGMRHRSPRRWGSVLAGMLLWMRELSRPAPVEGRRVLAVTGRQGVGKTAWLRDLARQAADDGWTVRGFVQDRVEEGDGRVRYVAVRLPEGAGSRGMSVERVTVAVGTPGAGFTFTANGFASARSWALDSRNGAAGTPSPRTLIVIDELGILEARGDGHAHTLNTALAAFPDAVFALSLRKNRLGDFRQNLGLPDRCIIDLDESDPAAPSRPIP